MSYTPILRLAVLGLLSTSACLQPKAPEVPTSNPLGGTAAHGERFVTPMGYECRPDQPMTFDLSASESEICLEMQSSDVYEAGRQKMSSPVETQLKIDGVATTTFSLEPEGPPSAFSQCQAKSAGTVATQWVARYRGCLPNAGQLTEGTNLVEVVFPATGDDAFVSFRFSGAQPAGS